MIYIERKRKYMHTKIKKTMYTNRKTRKDHMKYFPLSWSSAFYKKNNPNIRKWGSNILLLRILP
jgi:hypothetical protein